MSEKVIQSLTFTEFSDYLRFFRKPVDDEDQVLFNLYEDIVEILAYHQEKLQTLPKKNLDHGRLILYLLHDYEFFLSGQNYQERLVTIAEDSFTTHLLTTIVDKYSTSVYLKYEEPYFYSAYSTQISTLNVYLNFIAHKLNQLVSRQKDNVYLELLSQGFSLCRTVIELLTSGFAKEALSTWRSLHEVEATLSLIIDQQLLKAYQRHILYNAAFYRLIPQEKCDEIFLEIKGKMNKLNLKSKDTRRYIEYGWIAAHPAFDPTIHKFNFRDGVQRLAGFIEARDIYQKASEASHGSPLLLFIDQKAFFHLTLKELYSSFLTIEAQFAAVYGQMSDKIEFGYYEEVRRLYLKDIHFVNERLVK